MNPNELDPMTERDFRDKGVPVSIEFIRAAGEIKGKQLRQRKYIPKDNPSMLPLTLNDMQKILASGYDYAVIHDPLDGCGTFSILEDKYSKIPCKLHGFDN